MLDDGDQTITATVSVNSATDDQNYSELTAIQWTITNTDRPLDQLSILIEDGMMRVYDSGTNELVTETALGGDSIPTISTGDKNDTIVVSPSQVAIRPQIRTAGGNDTVAFRPQDVRLFDGGDGTDTARIEGDHSTLDLENTTIELVSIERIDLTATGKQLFLASVEKLKQIFGQDSVVIVVADQSDIVNLGNGWQLDQPGFDGEQLWHRFVGDGTTVLMANGLFWTNPLNRIDVDRSGEITASDALKVINRLSAQSTTILPVPGSSDSVTDYFDVTGDGEATALDALQVINYLIITPQNSEGESAVTAIPTWLVTERDRRTDRESREPTALLENDANKSQMTPFDNTVDDDKFHPLEFVEPEPNPSESDEREVPTLQLLDAVFANWS